MRCALWKSHEVKIINTLVKKPQWMSGEYAICSGYEKCTPGLCDKNFVKQTCKPFIDGKNYTTMTCVLREPCFF